MLISGFDDKVAIGKRLRRLSHRIDHDANQIYQDQGIHFEQRWFGILNQLALNETMSVTGLAHALQITHASISETRKSLENAKLIQSAPDPSDGRQRLLSLTGSGKKFFATLRPIWQAMEDSSKELNTEARDIISALDRLSDVLEKKSLFERVTEKLK